MTILVVEDDELTLELLAQVLRSAGHEVLTAGDGFEALKMLRARVCRMVVTDWNMPGMSGLDLCRAIRADSTLGYTYIIMLTASRDQHRTIQGLDAGADDFLVKPVNHEELLVRVRAGERLLAVATRDELILCFARLAEFRDFDTGQHLERVQHYAHAVATYLHENRVFEEIDASFVQTIFQTSPLHDIGKVGIPDSILCKPGPLTKEEFGVMKTHTTKGAEILEPVMRHQPGASYLRMALDIALYHHERFDGSGYPQGIKRDAIPLSARIVAIVDVYDALTSKRVYKDAKPHSEVREMILSESGKHFDPRIVNAFFAIEDTILQIRARFNGEVN